MRRDLNHTSCIAITKTFNPEFLVEKRDRLHS